MNGIAQSQAKRNQVVNIQSLQAPYSEEAEAAVLGAILTNPDTYVSVAAFLSEQDFYILRHAYIWEGIARLFERGDKLDFITAQQELRATGRLNDIGGPAYLLTLINNTPTSANAEIYGRLVERAAVRRRYLAAADEIRALALDEGEVTVEILEAEADRRLMLARRSGMGEITTMRAAIGAHFERTEEAVKQPTDILGIPSLLPEMNKLTRGFRPKKLYVFAGRPGMGKSSYLLSEAAHMARLGSRVAIFTMEMPEEEVVNNLVAAEINVPSDRIETGDLTEDEWTRYVKASGSMAEWSLFIDDTAGLTPMQARNRCRKLVYEWGLDVVFIDYIQLMSGGGEDRYSNRDQEIGYISRSLKGMAKELNIPVIAAAQLNREVDKREDKRPMLSDLRESGNIENDADMVAFLYREDYYTGEQNIVSPVETAIAKHRGGQRGMVTCGFYGKLKKFVALEQKR